MGMSTALQVQNYMPTADAAAELGLTDGRIRQMLRAGEIVGAKLGTIWAVPLAEVERIKHMLHNNLPATADAKPT